MRKIVCLTALLTLVTLGYGQGVTVAEIAQKHREYQQKFTNFSADFTQRRTISSQIAVTKFGYWVNNDQYLVRSEAVSLNGKKAKNRVDYHSEIDGDSIHAVGEFGTEQLVSRDKTQKGIGVLPLDFGYIVEGRPLVDLLENEKFSLTASTPDATWGRAYLLRGTVPGVGQCSLWVSAKDFLVFRTVIQDDNYVYKYELEKTVSQDGVRLPQRATYQQVVDGKTEITVTYTAQRISLGGVTPDQVQILAKLAPKSRYADKPAGFIYRVNSAGKLVKSHPIEAKQPGGSPNYFGLTMVVVLAFALCCIASVSVRRRRSASG